MNKSRFLFITSLIFIAALSRLIPHPPNFAPVGALALFGGAVFSRKWEAFLIPFAAMLLSDLILGFHSLMPVVYGTGALVVMMGLWLRGRATTGNVVFMSVISAFVFFFITNFAVWATSGMYPQTGSGLLTCYAAGIPFFWNTMASNLFYALLLFGGLTLAEKRWPVFLSRRPLASTGCCA